VALTSNPNTVPDHYMIYEAQYAQPIWRLFLPLLMR
jgi:hypothetical protein